MSIGAFADVIPAGTEVAVRPDQPIQVARWDRGRIYPARVARDIVARDGDVAIPAGSYAELIVRQTGPDVYTLDLESVSVNGRRYTVDLSGPEFNARRNDYDNGSGLVGSIIGAIANANGADVETRGSEIRVPAGALIRFRLAGPMRIVGAQDPGYQQGDGHYHHEHDWYR